MLFTYVSHKDQFWAQLYVFVRYINDLYNHGIDLKVNLLMEIGLHEESSDIDNCATPYIT